MEDQTEDVQTKNLTHCCVCKEELGTTLPLITLLCECRAHTECYMIDHMAKQWDDNHRETCPQCDSPYIPENVREAIDQELAGYEHQTVISDEEVVNPCFALEKGSPEFVTDLKKAKDLQKVVAKHKKEYNQLVSTVVKKYKEDTKQMANILKSTRNDAMRKITSAECSKQAIKATRRFASHVSRMSRRYEFGHRDWMRFARMRHPFLYHSFYQYRSSSFFGWRLRRRFRYGL